MRSLPRINFVSFTFFLAFGLGAFAGIAMALLAVALARPEDKTTVIEPTPVFVAVVPSATPSPSPVATPTATPVPVQRTLTTLQVHIGPDTAYAVLGTLARGSEVEVRGRDSSGDWLAINFPPGSSARGWVPAHEVDGLTLIQVFRLDVLQASLIPTSPATSTPTLLEGNDGVPAGETATPGTATSTPASALTTPTARVPVFGPTDLALSSVGATSDGRITVVIRNAGPADSPSAGIDVTVQGVGSETLSTGTLLAGQTVELRTSSLRLTESSTVVVTIDPVGLLADIDRTNNTRSFSLAP